MNGSTWEDGTPRSQGNAFDRENFRSDFDHAAFRIKSNRPETPGGFAAYNGTIQGGLSLAEKLTGMKHSNVVLPGSHDLPPKKKRT